MERDDVGEHDLCGLVVSAVKVEFRELAVGFNDLCGDSKVLLFGERRRVPFLCLDKFGLN